MKIEKLVLLTNDLKATRDFYTGKLNFEIKEEINKTISFIAGETVLVFKETPIDKPVYHFAFNISSNKINEAAEWCESKGLQLLPYPANQKVIDFPNWNAKSIYFLDNNGNILEFIARFDLDNENNLSFDRNQIINVSEMGMVVDDVNEYCRSTNDKYGIPLYEKQPPSPTFSVMGDAGGLLIVVPAKRKWFPTKISSDKFSVEIVFEQGGTRYELAA